MFSRLSELFNTPYAELTLADKAEFDFYIFLITLFVSILIIIILNLLDRR